jgi:hypothetical protein
MNPSPIQTGNGMMDMLKAQLMTMTMVSSMNGPEKTGNFFNVIYIFLATGVIDFICKSVFPGLGNIVTKYYREQINANKLISEIVTSDGKKNIKSASITILVNIADHENMFGQAMLDYITNNENTKHISFKKQNFVLNQSDTIEIYEDFFVKLNENKMVDHTDKPGNQGIEQTIELFSYTKSMQELRAFLNKITHEYKIKIENKLGDKMYYFNQHPMNAAMINGQKDYTKLPNNSVFTMKVFQTNRKFTNLFGPEISVVRKRVEFFTKNRKWYDTKGIPYTLGLLLSGQAGAGKTSSIKCLANETKRHIININLNNDITKTQLENLFFNELIMVLNVSTGQSEKYYIPLDQRIYVLEDIDAQSDLVMERTAKVKPVDKCPDVPGSIKTNPNKPDTYSNSDSCVQAEKIDLSFLLNLLDGVLEIPGRIVIMTSNFPEKLDNALIRPGRIDVIANFTKCSHPTMIEMMEFFYDIVLTHEEKETILRTNEYVISPAEMSKIMFENFGNHSGAIQKLGEIVVPSIQSIEIEDVPIEVQTTIDANFQPRMVDEIEKKLLESSPDRRTSNLDIDINSRVDALTNSYFPDDNRIDRMNDREQQLSECATFTDRMNANWLTSVGNEVTGKCFTPPKSTNVLLPYESELQTNQFSSFE